MKRRALVHNKVIELIDTMGTAMTSAPGT